MKYYIVSVLDSAVGAFGRPVFARAKGEAIRSFMDEVNRKSTSQEPNPLNQHPQDYRLFFVGEFDDTTARFICPSLPEHIIDAAEALPKTQ